jgi:hypothetical protein
MDAILIRLTFQYLIKNPARANRSGAGVSEWFGRLNCRVYFQKNVNGSFSKPFQEVVIPGRFVIVSQDNIPKF